MITLGKSGTIHDRRLAASRLRQEDAVRILFNEIAPAQKDRPGGYTRIVKLLPRKGDAAQLAILEWVDEAVQERPRKTEAKPAETPKPAPEKEASSSQAEASAPSAPAAEAEPAQDEPKEKGGEPDASSGEEKPDQKS